MRKRARRRQQLESWRTTVGVLAMGYGSVAALGFLVYGLFGGRLWSFVQAVLAGAIVFGGRLVLQRHPQGPACAGIACVALCFISAWFLLLGAFQNLALGHRLLFLRNVAQLVVFYSFPAWITWWSLQIEQLRQKDEQDELNDRFRF
jgi:hypothetical protein